MLDPTQAELDARLEGAVGPVRFALNGKDVITLAILATALGFMLWVFTLFLKDVSESLKTAQLSAAHAVLAAIEKHDRMIEIGNDNARLFTQQHSELIAVCTKPARLLR